MRSKFEIPWYIQETLLFLAWGVCVSVAEKAVEHAEQKYLAWKFKKQEEEKKRVKVSKRQRR